MWSCSDVGQEILAVGDCLAKRAKAATKAKCQNMENGMVENVCTKIKKMQLCIANGHELYEYISQSKLSEEHKAKLVECVDQKLSTPNQEEPSQGFVVKPQLLVNIGSYLTAADWGQLEDGNISWLAKSTVVIKRLKMLGVRSLHERTSQHCLAALLSTLNKLPDHTMIWEMLVSFKSTFKQSELPPAAHYLQTFPASPVDLPAHIKKAAYVGDDQPISHKNIDVIKHIAGSHISCRSTNKLLKSSGDKQGQAAKGQAAKGQPASSAEIGNGDQNQQSRLDPMQMCATMMQAMFMAKQGQNPFANMFNTTEVKISPKKKEPKAIEDGTAAEPSVPALPAPSSASAFEPKKRTATQACLPEKNEASAEDSANEFEQAAFNALLAREEKKKPSPAAKAKGKAKAKAKGKAKAVMKRPSSKALEFEVPKPTAADLEKKVNVYASRVWHAARLFAKTSLKLDDESVKNFARLQGQKARQLYHTAKEL